MLPLATASLKVRYQTELSNVVSATNNSEKHILEHISCPRRLKNIRRSHALASNKLYFVNGLAANRNTTESNRSKWCAVLSPGEFEGVHHCVGAALPALSHWEALPVEQCDSSKLRRQRLRTANEAHGLHKSEGALPTTQPVRLAPVASVEAIDNEALKETYVAAQ